MPSPSYELAHCVVCGHSDARVVASSDDVRAEVEWLWEYHEKRLRPGTPPRRLIDRVAFSERPPLRLVECTECGLVYRNPIEREYELAATYTDDAVPAETLRSLHDTQLPVARGQARELRRALGGRGGSGLEVGSYVGAFLVAAKAERLQVEGLDVNAAMNAFTRQLGFAVHDGTLDNFTTDRTFDVVAIWNTFDQLVDPRAAAHASRRLLRPNGVLAIRVPNGAFYAAMRRRLGHGDNGRRGLRWAAARASLAQNNLLAFPYRWGFTPHALTALLRDTGFTVHRVRGDVLVPTADEWTRPWARVEEALVKRGMSAAAQWQPRWAPWFEVYATRD